MTSKIGAAVAGEMPIGTAVATAVGAAEATGAAEGGVVGKGVAAGETTVGAGVGPGSIGVAVTTYCEKCRVVICDEGCPQETRLSAGPFGT